MDEMYKEVYFDQYCTKCKHSKEPETSDACDECLEHPQNLYSHKPLRFETKSGKDYTWEGDKQYD